MKHKVMVLLCGAGMLCAVQVSAQELPPELPAAGAGASAPAETVLVSKWHGSAEFGGTFQTGNTRKQHMRGSAEVKYTLDAWENTLKLKAVSGKERSIHTDEEYRANNQTRRNLSARDYVFGELEYINDRFSGYEYRLSELFGYGYHIIREEDMKLSAEASAGLRQSSLTSGEDENSALGKVGGDFEWKFRENLTFTEALDVSVASDAVITESQTALKSSLTDVLYLKLGLDIEHISDVPANRKHTDTTTSVTLGYEF